MDDVSKMLGGGGIVGAISGLVGGEGGLQGLVGTLSDGGLGDVVGSWVGTGPNKAVEPAKLASALGPAKVQELAGQSGISVDAFLPMLASALPAVVDAITPDGQVPGGDAAAGLDIGGLLEGLSSAAKAGPSSPLAALGDLLGGSKG